MAGSLYRYLHGDHERFAALLDRALAAPPGTIDLEAYSEFREGLLRHIGIEEKIVLPAIARWQGGRKAEIAERLRRDHSAIVSLLVPPPSAAIIRTLQSIFALHNPIEEQHGGLYELLETLAGAEAGRMLAEIKAAPPVLVLPYNEKPDALEFAMKAVARAGYEFDPISSRPHNP